MQIFPPSVILVRPQMGENIGAAARAMMNFGLRDLRLVAPRDGWPNPKAHEMSAHADGIIEAAQVFATLEEAVADAEYILASTARPRQLPLPVFTPRAGAEEQARYARTALLFGPENNGLSSDDLAVAHGIVTIPTDAANTSLNIAQSVVILAYEYWQARGEAGVVSPEPEPPASAGEVEGLYVQLAGALEKKGFFRVVHKKPSMQRNLRLLLTKAGFSAQEVQTLRGIVRVLEDGDER